MLGRAILLIALVASGALAGCIGGKDDPAVDKQSLGNKTGVVDANQSAAPNGAGQLSAYKETNATETSGIGASMHPHDYWHGQTRKVIWQTGIALIPLPLEPEGLPPGTAIADFSLPPGTEHNLTFEGTDHLELLMT